VLHCENHCEEAQRKEISAVSAKIGPKSDPAAAPQFPGDQRVGRLPTARKRPHEGSAFGTTVPGPSGHTLLQRRPSI
jgi:hypothetical protein